jgi:hypothetical protein
MLIAGLLIACRLRAVDLRGLKGAGQATGQPKRPLLTARPTRCSPDWTRSGFHIT